MAPGDERAPRAIQLPSQVQVTVLADPGARPLRRRLACADARVKTLAAAGLVLLVAAALAVAAGSVSHGRATAVVPALSREPGPTGVAAAYGFPPRCLTVTILSGYPVYARADFNRGSQCGRYNGDVTAIFERVGGAWRPVLHAVQYACPVRSLPSSVQARLAVCTQR